MKTLCSRAIVLACLVGTAAAAQSSVRIVSNNEDATVRATVVSIAGLDLASPNGRRHLDRQLRYAAARVCGRPNIATAESQQCRTAALTQARRQVDDLPRYTRTAALPSAPLQSAR